MACWVVVAHQRIRVQEEEPPCRDKNRDHRSEHNWVKKQPWRTDPNHSSKSYCPGLTPVETIFPNSTQYMQSWDPSKSHKQKAASPLLFLLLLHIWIFTKTNSIQLVLMCLSIKFSTVLENLSWFFGKRVQDPSLNPKSIALDIVLAPSATVQGSNEVSPDTV